MLLIHDLWKKGGFCLVSASNNIDQLTCRQVTVYLYKLSDVLYESIGGNACLQWNGKLNVVTQRPQVTTAG